MGKGAVGETPDFWPFCRALLAEAFTEFESLGGRIVWWVLLLISALGSVFAPQVAETIRAGLDPSRLYFAVPLALLVLYRVARANHRKFQALHRQLEHREKKRATPLEKKLTITVSGFQFQPDGDAAHVNDTMFWVIILTGIRVIHTAADEITILDFKLSVRLHGPNPHTGASTFEVTSLREWSPMIPITMSLLRNMPLLWSNMRCEGVTSEQGTMVFVLPPQRLLQLGGHKNVDIGSIVLSVHDPVTKDFVEKPLMQFHWAVGARPKVIGEGTA